MVVRGKMVFDRVRNLIGGSSDKEGSDTKEDVVMPTNPGVIKRTSKEVDLSRGDIKEAIERFQEVGAMAYPAIDKRAVRDGDDKSSKPMSDDDGPSFFYVVHEDDGVLVVGGAKNLLLTFADRLNLSNTETRAVTTAHRIAADMNGFSEHMVMDDIFMVPKREASGDAALSLGTGKGSGGAEKKGERIREIEENGFALNTSEVLDELPDIEEKKRLGASYGCEGGSITLTLNPKDAEDGSHHAVMQPGGDLLLPQEIALGLEIEHRDIDWRMDDGNVVGRMEDGLIEDEVVDKVRTKLAKDSIEEEVQAHLPGSHTSTLGIGEDNEVAIYLEPDKDGDGFLMVLRPDGEGAPTDRTVEIKDIGTGTEMLCFAVPENIADVLDINDDEERQIEWGMREDEMVGEVVR